MKKVGLVVDNYKLIKLKEIIEDMKLFKVYEGTFTKDTTLISVMAPEDKLEELKNRMKKMDIDLKLSN